MFRLPLLAGSLLLFPGAVRALTPEQADFVEKRVRPLLVEKCVRCHGPTKQKAGLRLDSRAGALAGGDNGPALQPGDPDKSLLIQAVRRNGELKMPPQKPLTPEAIAVLVAWVKMGAPWPDAAAPTTNAGAWKKHWAFQPVQDPPLPAVKDRNWPRTSIDPFILARLEARGLTPSTPAGRRTLLRRVTFDLIGLPPTPEEVAAFEADHSPNAYKKVVDRLLANPHYGERWGRYWLDLARYADTKGYVFFQDKEFPWAYTYRDYVVRSFNEDLPYNRFLLEQLAADQLPLGRDRRSLTALGFLTVGGRFMNNVHDILDDRIDVTMRGLQGLTVACARCHDHKFDPIPQKDYYSLYGVFASSIEPAEPPLFYDPPATPAYQAFQKELAEREQAFSRFVRAQYDRVMGGARTRAAEYLLAANALRDKPPTADFMLLADGNDLNPTLIVRWQTYLARTRRSHHPVWIPWHEFAQLPEKDFSDRARELCVRLAAPRAGDPAVNLRVAQAFASHPPRSLQEAAKGYAELLGGTERAWQKAQRQAEHAKTPLPSALPDPSQEQLRRVFLEPEAPTSLPLELFDDLALFPDRASQGELQKLRKAVEDYRVHGKGAPPRAMVLVDAVVPHEPRVFRRGSPANPGEAVPRQLPALLAGRGRQPFRHGSGRLELAQALVAPGNRLTARVFVNRVWMHHFGTGLVSTPSDFGLRSEPPTHPLLLDHLASTFMKQGWSIKKLHRLIVMSATYRQTSGDRPACRQVDAENRLLWRMNRQRLDFEATRDSLLAVAGRLDPALGGPPVRNILAPASGRRTLYGFLDRLQVPGLYRTFDFPSPDTSSPRRDSTTVPQQALFLMNNPFVLECARGLLRRPEMAQAKDLPRRVEYLHRLLYGRSAAGAEIDLARVFLGDRPSQTAWERYAQALLLANEFVFVD
jgi:mono/diheme cytochrome c family protein